MFRRFVFAAAAVLFACPSPPIADRCGPGLPPCSTGFVCVAGLCARSEADSGAPDAGVPTDGGGSIDAGATDSGQTFGCDGGCSPWAVCVASATSTACVNGRLEVSEPVDATIVRAGQSVAVSARFLLVDGGAWPNTLAIPVQATWGPQTMLLSGIGGSLPGLSDAGQGAVVFGWDGGPVEPRGVSFTACAAEVVASCDSFMECAPSSSGGNCVSRGYVVEWVSPDAGSTTNQPSVPAEIRVSKPDAGVVTLTSIPVTGATAFTGAAGRYTGALPIAAPDGMKMFTAGWPSDGASSTLAIERDTIAPTVTVIMEPRNGPDPDVAAPTAWKKDEKALLKVTVGGGRPAVATDIRPPPNGVVTVETCSGCVGTCRCFGIDVSSTPLNGLRGPMGVQVLPIADLSGNLASQTDAGFEVTRVRWIRTAVVTSTAPEVFAPTISESGSVVFALASRSLGLPRVQVFDPSGRLLWGAVESEVVTAPTVASGNTLWVPTVNGVGVARMSALSLADGGVEAVRCVDAGFEYFSSMALASFDGGVAIPVGVGDVVALGSQSCPTTGSGSIAATRTPLALRQTGSMVEVFGANFDHLTKFQTQGGSWGDRGTRLNVGFDTQGLAFHSANDLIGAGGSPTIGMGGVFLVSSSDHLDAGQLMMLPPMASAPLVSADSIVGVSATGSSMRIPLGPDGISDAGVEVGSLLVVGGQKLVLGRARIIAAGVVAATPLTNSLRVGQLRPGDLSVEWGAELDSSQATPLQVATPALDVLRADGGAKDCTRPLGVLYLSSSLGLTAKLHALLVDSNGLDPAAPWPKFQRDNANRGNISLPTTPWTCP